MTTIDASSRVGRLHADHDVRGAVLAEGFTSAVEISQHSQGEFVRKIAARLDGDAGRAHEAYAQAVRISNAVMHAWANVHSAVRDPHFNALKVNNLGTGGSIAFDDLPSYQALFGSLDYCSCDECRSIFGAAAYLVDLLRVIDAYVTQPNTGTLPAGYSFPERRPDIGVIPLTCDATNDTFPMLQVVNERLAALAAGYLGNPSDLYQALSTLDYPFQLPFHLRWNQILGYLDQLQMPLETVLAAFGAAAADIGRAYFGLSEQQATFVTTSLASNPDALATAYGVASDGLAGLATVTSFLTSTGLALSDLLSLLQQDLSAAELAGKVAAGFFINLGLSGNWLTYVPGDDGKGTPATIGGLAAAPNDPLDRIGRFVRLAARLGWDYPTLDWVLRCLGNPTTISADTIAQAGQAQVLADRLGLDLVTMSSVFGSIKPYGEGSGSVSATPFDVAFNDPRLVGTDVYRPATPLNPLYQSALRTWTIGSTDPVQASLAIRLAAATNQSLRQLVTLAANLWGAGSGVQVPLTFDNLATLYRHSVLQQALTLTVTDYSRLLALLGLTTDGKLNATLSLTQITQICDRADWLGGSGLSLDQLDYLLGGAPAATINPLFQPAAVPDWLATVRTATAGLTDDALDTAVIGQLALLFSISTELSTTLAAQALAAAPPPAVGWAEAFVAPPVNADGPPPYLDYVLQYLGWFSRWLVLTNQLALPLPVLNSLIAHPAAYGATIPLNFDSLYGISQFQQLVTEYSDRAGRLLNFVDPSTDPGGDPTAQLAAATGWNRAQLATLLTPFANEPNRVLVVTSIATQFGVLSSLGADPAFVTEQLIATTTDPASTWPAYTAVADQLLGMVRSQTQQAQWPAIAAQLEGAVQAELRDVLAPLVLFHISPDPSPVKSLNDLSDYLLIDIETSGVPQISQIREALNAAQQYLQRCRLGLEPVAIFEIPDAWWEWISNYTVWVANRQVFLYPENYLDPGLRKDATKLFDDLQNQLLQGEVTEGAVDAVYRTYVDGLVKLSDLEYVDAYRCTVNDVEQGPLDTTFLFARTSTDPYNYYSISYANGVWDSWQPIGITIPAAVITPIYAFNRLFLFWVEQSIVKDAQIPANAGAGSTQGVAYQATIKYSFIDFNGNWIQPQALVQDAVIYYMPTESDQTGALGALKSRLDLFGMSDLFWNKVSVVVVDPPGQDRRKPVDPSLQKLVINYGSLIKKDANSVALDQPISPPPPLTNPGSNALTFAQSIYDITTDYNQLVGAALYGYLPLVQSIVLDHQLNPSYVRRANEMIVLEADLRENAPPLVKPEIESVLGTLALATADCAYLANEMADYIPAVATTRPPLPISAASLQGHLLDAATAQTVFTALTTAGVIVNGAVAPSFAANPDLSTLHGTIGDPAIFFVREMLLAALGDPTLFATVPVLTAQAIAVKNRLGSFLLSVGDEAFLLTPRDVEYADLSVSTYSSPIPSSPLVFDSYFKPVDSTYYNAIFLDLVGNNIVARTGTSNYGLLSPSFGPQTNLSMLFAGEPSPARRAALIEQTRRILLALPSITMLNYDSRAIQRFVTNTSFISNDINAGASQQAYTDLCSLGFVRPVTNDQGLSFAVLNGEISATTDLSQILLGAPDSIREEIRVVLMAMPKLVLPTSFITADITSAQSAAAFQALVSHNILDSSGAIAASFSAATDLSYLFPDVAEPTRDVLIGEVRDVALKFFDSTYRIDSNEIGFDVERISARSSSRELSYALFAGGIEQALSLQTQNAPVIAKLPFDRLGASASQITPPPLADGAQIDFDGPYGLYFWELFYHAPLLVALQLAGNQQFEAAERWLRYILNPTVTEQFVQPDSFATADITLTDSSASYDALVTAGVLVAVTGGARVATSYTPATSLGPHFTNLPQDILDEYRAVLSNFQLATPASHYWQFRPFRNHTLESLLETLTDRTQIAVYEDDPFDPDAIARLRIGAYEKATVMRYVDLLLSWGDALFTQYTWEAITSATLLYTFAEDLLGARPVDLGPCPSPAAELTFDQIKAMYGSSPIPQFLIDLENSLPPMSGPVAGLNPPGTPFNALDAYFGVPQNDHLASYWDQVEDRLTKIRNGENINGVPTPLALWDPPLDPMALVTASASGNGFLPAGGSAAAKPTSCYRFGPLFDQATALAGQVATLGSSLLSAMQNHDAATLDMLRNTQETALLNLTTSLKQQQIDELVTSIAGLTLSMSKSQYEADYYNGLIADGLSGQETTTRVLEAEAILFQTVSIPVRGIAIGGYVSPSIFGLADGGMQWGDAINQGAEIAAATSQLMSLSSALTSTTGEFQRRADDWDFQAKLATRDVAIYQNQIDNANQQLVAARQDLLVHQKSIEQSEAISTFLSSRFTNADLYSWMSQRLAAVYFQSYTAAVAAARSAELAYQFEQNRADSFIVYGYWDNLHRGLCAGENLMYSLNQLKAAYLEANQRKLEITKTISLRQLDPSQLEQLRAGQPATFAITETMLDFDFPGQYGRQISSVTVSIPAIVGPGQNLNAVLIQNSSKVAMIADKKIVDYLVALDTGHTPSGPPAGLRQDWLPLQQIALSRGVNDSGMFELDFSGDQFMPFEGTGAISSWQLAIPPENNRIDLSQLSDVVFTVNYTALDGGSTYNGSPSFRTDVIDILRKYKARYTGGLYLDAVQSLSSAWYAFLHPAPNPATQTLSFALQPAMLPYLPTVVLDGVQVKIDVASTVKQTDSTTFAVLSIGSHDYPLTFISGYATLPTSLNLAAADFLTDWSLTLTIANAPDPHLVLNGQLNPAALLDFEFLLSYSADVLPPA